MIAERAHWIGFGIGAVALVAHNLSIQPWTLDDAFISFRYAEHFAAGEGLVYNPGEYVEGYTTFLWVALLGVGHFVGFDTVWLAKALGIGLALATLGLVANAHRFIPSLGNQAAGIAAALLGTTGIFTAWAMSGMEVALIAFWVTLAVLLHFRSLQSPANHKMAVAAGVSCALAAMSHPEFGLVFVALFADRLRDGVRNHNRGWLGFGLGFAILYLPYYVWRYSYYGWLLPNTFYAKVGGSWAQVQRGVDYSVRFAGLAAWLLLPIAAGAVLSSEMRRSQGRVALLLAVIVALQTVYVIAVGGDVMPAFRFFSPVMPLVCLLCAMGLVGLGPRPFVAVGLATAIMAHGVWQSSHHRELHRRIANGKVGYHGKEVGLWLKENVPADSLLATNTAGGLAYYSGLRIIDMLGLNDERIAHRHIPSMGRGKTGHEKGDGVYVLSRKPDYIQFGSVHGSPTPQYRSGAEIVRTRQFRRWYELKTHTLPSGARLYLYERLGEPRLVPTPR
jgi:arabinofuranosyltransferase